MLVCVVAAEISIDRPQTMMEAAVLGAILFTIAFIFVRGLHSFVGTFEGRFTFYFWWVFGALFVVFLYTYRPWEQDPILQADIEIRGDGIQGIEAETDPGHYEVDPDYTHNDN